MVPASLLESSTAWETMLVRTDWMSRLPLTACPTSPSARSSSTERVSSCVRSSSSLNRRTFSIAITA